jgi:hypothetical protein
MTIYSFAPVTGAILPVSAYREKILTLDQPGFARIGCTPHMIVPAASVKDGVLVDVEEVRGMGVADTSVYVECQVRGA